MAAGGAVSATTHRGRTREEVAVTVGVGGCIAGTGVVHQVCPRTFPVRVRAATGAVDAARPAIRVIDEIDALVVAATEKIVFAAEQKILTR
jgi:hypothetical protein